MNEEKEIETLKKLMEGGFFVYVKTKKGTREVIDLKKESGLVVTKTYGGIEIIEAPKTFMNKHFLIKPRIKNANQIPPVEEIYNYLKQKNDLYYRGRKIVKIQVKERRLILETEDGYESYEVPSDMLNHPIYTRWI